VTASAYRQHVDDAVAVRIRLHQVVEIQGGFSEKFIRALLL
jgi:hypothetical protein